MGFLLLFIAVAVIFYIKNQNNKTRKAKPIKPPSADVILIGCEVDCGYFVPKLNGNYDFVKQNGRVVGFCNYQNCETCQGRPCQFAKDHPEKLEKSVFDDDFLDP